MIIFYHSRVTPWTWWHHVISAILTHWWWEQHLPLHGWTHHSLLLYHILCDLCHIKENLLCLEAVNMIWACCFYMAHPGTSESIRASYYPSPQTICLKPLSHLTGLSYRTEPDKINACPLLFGRETSTDMERKCRLSTAYKPDINGFQRTLFGFHPLGQSGKVCQGL